MRRLPAIVLLVLMLGAVLAGPTLAAKPANGCPAASSGWQRVDGAGWWAATVAGFHQEDMTTQEAAELFGFGSVDALRTWIIDGVIGAWDKNGNGFICMKDLPNTPGIPGFIINATDDNASSPKRA